MTTDEDTLRLWTVIDTDDREVREQVYEIELKMYESHPKQDFDFFVLSWDRLGSKQLVEMIPQGFRKIERHGVGR